MKIADVSAGRAFGPSGAHIGNWTTGADGGLSFKDNPNTDHPPNENAQYHWNQDQDGYLSPDGLYRVEVYFHGAIASHIVGYRWRKRRLSDSTIVDEGTLVESV